MKILCIHATAGAGHMKAAEAIYHGLKKYTNHEVVLADALDYTSPFFKKFYRESYFMMIVKFPVLWQIFFGLLDRPFMSPMMRFFRRIYNGFNAAQLHRFLIKEQFDYIFSTHFMPVEVASALKSKGQIKSKLVCVVTDYDVHRIWLGKNVDQYCVASSWTKEKIGRLGVSQSIVKITGIPTDEKFSAPKDKLALKKKFGLEDGKFTVLIATGSFGIGPIEEIIKQIPDIQVIVVCGHGKLLYDSLMQKKYSNTKVFAFVDNMEELMAVSDAMITKPGGLSISEALVVGLPLVFFSAIPGQEMNNIKVLKTFGVGISDCSVSKIADVIRDLSHSPDKVTDIHFRIKAVARPNAVKDIVQIL